jgi:hypothetical protein
MIRTALSAAVILFALTGCWSAPEPASNVSRNADRLQLVQESGRPEVTAEKIVRDIVGRVVQVSELNEAEPETAWRFEANEFRQVAILEKHVTENRLTLVVFMTTRNNPKPDEDPVQVSGKLQLQYQWKAGRWILKTGENLTLHYSIGVST